LLVCPSCSGVLLPCLPCIVFYNCFLLESNVRDRVNATHVALTQDGIKFVDSAKKNSPYRQMVGRVGETLAYSKITEVDIVEPADQLGGNALGLPGKSGPTCFMVDNVFSWVHVDTANSVMQQNSVTRRKGHSASSRACMHKLLISSLSDSQAFKEDVWAMVRGEGVNGIKPRIDKFTVVVGGTIDRGGKGVVERMTDLEALRDKGYVTPEEFDVKRKEILASA
jgi:hypothetical protein